MMVRSSKVVMNQFTNAMYFWQRTHSHVWWPLRADTVRSRGILERIPAGRWGEPDDLAGTTVFLASAASDYVNGIVLPVDGGWLGVSGQLRRADPGDSRTPMEHENLRGWGPVTSHTYPEVLLTSTPNRYRSHVRVGRRFDMH